MWQALYDELKAKNFMVVTVAMDSRAEASREWIEAAKPQYVSLIDREHRVAELYNMVNVPQAVWIDERGRIVRPTETAGFNDAFRSMDIATRTLPEEAQARRKQARDVYIAALKDWVAKGDKSSFAYSPAEAKKRLRLPTPEIVLANANFRLGRYLHAAGRKDEAEVFLQEAISLRPDSWNFWRQTADLEQVGKASSPEFWARVQSLGNKHYYEPADMPGMPS